MKLLNINRILMIDDPRNAAMLNYVAKRLGIYTVSYQHGKFNKYTVGLSISQFDCYFVWNLYYKNMYKSFYSLKPGKIIITGINKVNIKNDLVTKRAKSSNILWLEEDRVPINFYLKDIDYLIKKKFNVFLKIKPRDYQSLVISAKYNFCNQDSLEKSIHKYDIKYVIGSHSTALLESISYGAIPISFKPYSDYIEDLFYEGYIKVIHNRFELINFVTRGSKRYVQRKFADDFNEKITKKHLTSIFS